MGDRLLDEHRRDVVVCADLLGAFGVREADLRPSESPGEESLADLLDDVLRAAPDPTAYCRRTIAGADRGIDLPARYPRSALQRSLRSVFAAIEWECDLTRRFDGTRDLTVTDGEGRTRRLSFSYPDTPLGDDNFPAFVHAIDEELLYDTKAGFVLLSAGEDRWRAALVNERAVERARERFGDRVEAFDRPLLPVHATEAYLPEDEDAADDRGEGGDVDRGPWPEWARERAERLRRGVDSIEGFTFGPKEPPADRPIAGEPDDSAAARSATDQFATTLITEAEPEPSGADAGESDDGGFEIVGGGPSVSRSSDDGLDDVFDGECETVSSEFGTLSGSATTTRVSSDSFGAEGVEPDEDERYRALGAAVWAGGDISLSSLLDDDEFIPEIPGTETSEVRIAFEEDPLETVGERAETVEGDDGFVWVGGGGMQETRSSRSL